MKNLTLSPTKVIIVVVCIILAIAAAVLIGYSLSKPDPADDFPHNGKGLISSEQAMKIALDDAGLSRDQVSLISCSFDEDENNMTYDVDFIANKSQYEYIVDADDGKVLSSSIENIKVAGKEPTQNQTPGEGSDAERISTDEAKAAALAHFGIEESAAENVNVSLDDDDGVSVYEVDFQSSGMEYEVEINAFTGAVYKYNVENIFED